MEGKLEEGQHGIESFFSRYQQQLTGNSAVGLPLKQAGIQTRAGSSFLAGLPPHVEDLRLREGRSNFAPPSLSLTVGSVVKRRMP
ncbi:hypothetical protein [Roseibium sp. RKSG952]|uniref:hypothetical protein n=1 Tax=Roseibium sp. RKSG952 TaxID=2529384 RepID=UPI0012BD108A|nr:hypothetical protein [Roseibium sp. RKSG952]MTH98395.1 hypothetical protein [Roseibium sp. RKSG952]